MPLALFDLDNTLLAGDSDYLWGQFLCEQGVVDSASYERENQRFYEEYKEGKLDIYEFLEFSLEPLAAHSLAELDRWHEQFMEEKIEPIISHAAQSLVDKHRQAGDTLLVITATNAFVTAPIVRRFGIPHLIATQPEMENNRYTGKVDGIPCFQEGKVRRLEAWMKLNGETLEGACFYSDSHNDIPLLNRVTTPVAVDPDSTLATYATERDWPILHLHTPDAPS